MARLCVVLTTVSDHNSLPDIITWGLYPLEACCVKFSCSIVCMQQVMTLWQ